jgi:hypothetical protein
VTLHLVDRSRPDPVAGPGHFRERVIVPIDEPALTPWDFAADVRYLLDVVGDLAAGRNPDADRRRAGCSRGRAAPSRR